MIKYDTIKKAIKGTAIAAGLVAALTLYGCKKNSNPDLTSKFTYETAQSTQENEIEYSGQTINITFNCGSGSNGRCYDNNSQAPRNNGRSGGCRDNTCADYVLSRIKNCSLPNKYNNLENLCENPASHLTCSTDSDHEEEISPMNSDGSIDLIRKNPSYIDNKTISVNYRDGSGPHQGARLPVTLLVQNADTCEHVEINPGAPTPAHYKNVMVTLLGHDANGAIYKVASTPMCGVNNSRSSENPNPNPTPTPLPTPAPTIGPAPNPIPNPTPELESILNLPILNDNQWNYPIIDWSKIFGNQIPEEVYIGVCLDGTDGKGKVIIPCIEEKIIGTDFKRLFSYINKSEKGAIYEGFIPDIPGTQEASYTIIGYKLDGQYHGTKVTSQTINNKNTQVKQKKKCSLKKIFNKKS